MTLQRKSHKLVRRAGLAGALPPDAPAAGPPLDNPAGGGQNDGGGNGNAQPPGGGDNGNAGAPANGNGNGIGGGAGGPGAGAGGDNGPSRTTSQPSNTPSTRPPPTQQQSTSSEAPPTTSSTPSSTSSTTTSSSSSTSSSTSSSSSSTSTSSASSDSQTSTSTHTFILTAPTQTNTLLPTPAPISATSSHTPSPTTSPSTSSGVKVGPVVGGIAGGLVGIAILGMLISFILRRLRKRNRRDTILGDDFRRSEFLGSNTPINDPPLQPPSMAQFSRDSTSSPGMAGQGAYGGGNHMYTDAAPAPYTAGRHAVPDWGATAGVGAAAAAASRHDYVQRSTEDVDDISHGVYSSQPQHQMAYNPEAYGSYAAYGHDNHAAAGGYQEATREYQGQPAYSGGGYTGQEFGGGPTYGVAVADPSHGGSAAGAHPSTPTLRDQSKVTSNRQENARSVVQDDDVYGGI